MTGKSNVTFVPSGSSSSSSSGSNSSGANGVEPKPRNWQPPPTEVYTTPGPAGGVYKHEIINGQEYVTYVPPETKIYAGSKKTGARLQADTTTTVGTGGATATGVPKQTVEDLERGDKTKPRMVAVDYQAVAAYNESLRQQGISNAEEYFARYKGQTVEEPGSLQRSRFRTPTVPRTKSPQETIDYSQELEFQSPFPATPNTAGEMHADTGDGVARPSAVRYAFERSEQAYAEYNLEAHKPGNELLMLGAIPVSMAYGGARAIKDVAIGLGRLYMQAPKGKELLNPERVGTFIYDTAIGGTIEGVAESEGKIVSAAEVGNVPGVTEELSYLYVQGKIGSKVAEPVGVLAKDVRNIPNEARFIEATEYAPKDTSYNFKINSYDIEGQKGVLVPPEYLGAVNQRGTEIVETINPVTGERVIKEPYDVPVDIKRIEDGRAFYDPASKSITMNEGDPSTTTLFHEAGHALDNSRFSQYSWQEFNKLTPEQQVAANKYYQERGYEPHEVPGEFFADKVAVVGQDILKAPDPYMRADFNDVYKFIDKEATLKDTTLRENVAAQLTKLTTDKTSSIGKAPELQTQLYPKKLNAEEQAAYERTEAGAVEKVFARAGITINPPEKPSSLSELARTEPALAKQLAKENGQTVFNPEETPRTRDLTTEERAAVAREQAGLGKEAQAVLSKYPTKPDSLVVKDGQVVARMTPEGLEIKEPPIYAVSDPASALIVTGIHVGNDIIQVPKLAIESVRRTATDLTPSSVIERSKGGSFVPVINEFTDNTISGTNTPVLRAFLNPPTIQNEPISEPKIGIEPIQDTQPVQDRQPGISRRLRTQPALDTTSELAQETQPIQQTTQTPMTQTEIVNERPVFQITNTPQTPSTPPPTILPKRSSEQSRGPARFKAQVRKRGVFVNIGESSNPREARRIAEENVRNTASASFKVTDNTGRAIDFGSSQDFKPSKREGNVFVQKKEKRISTAGEKREITFAPKKKGFNNPFGGKRKWGF